MKPASSEFVNRHIGPSADDVRQMLTELGLPSLETLIAQSVPDSIRLERDLEIPQGIGEFEALRELRRKFDGVPVAKSMIGQGYYRTKTPPVIARNLFENPAWYTSYTPYQAEISQGRLELLFHFQTLVSELAGLPVANSSLLDEATAIAEAAGIAIRHHRSKRDRIVLANELHTQNRDVLASRCELIGVELVDGLESAGSEPERVAAVVIQTPDTHGQIPETKEWVEWARTNGALAIFVCDPMALLLTRSPGEAGADICVGSIQRYGVPMGNGGPHAAFIAVAEKFTRMLPGRLVGQSQDMAGEQAYRLALQTREQHIRREKATSNICTAQALLANMAASYAIWHGPDGLKAIAGRIHALAARFAASLEKGGWSNRNTLYFDTLSVSTGKKTDAVLERAANAGFLFRRIDDGTLAISFDEMSDEEELTALCDIFEIQLVPETDGLLDGEARGAEFLTQPVFHENRSETAMMRYLRRLADKDLALDRAMIPLGSCTMKLNAAAEMAPVSWPEISEIHPFSPPEYLAGYASMIEDLDRWLCEITGFARISFQPNAGSQGEFAGLAAIRRFHDSNDDRNRRVCLIPSSAHGTNPASAQMAGMEVVVVACDDHGNVDLDDLREKAKKHRDRLAALMITYPSTHGVFESAIGEICGIVHEHGGQVYLDGANLNALVGLARPADFGADVCHMNLHKTFCIPHGGGGPGVGPIGVAPHLVDHLPGHFRIGGDHPVSAAPEGSASILPITWMYIRMMGGSGLKRATEIAILNANYLAKKLDPHFPVLYRGEKGWVAHECILDTRQIRSKADIDVEDIAKRLIDYGFHAPTMSWPVAGTLMIEPTESEPKEELDRFAQAMAAIRQEISEVESGKQPADDNCLVNAPHTAQALTQAEWPHAYSRAVAIDPSGTGLAGKYWPPVARIDNVYGDRNLVCACPPVSEYAKAG